MSVAVDKARFVEVAISIQADELLKLYRTPGAVVHARTVDGRRVQFPAQSLRPWVTRDGIRGKFRIYFDPDNRLSRIEPNV